jgi:hypothetical protein
MTAQNDHKRDERLTSRGRNMISITYSAFATWRLAPKATGMSVRPTLNDLTAGR